MTSAYTNTHAYQGTLGNYPLTLLSMTSPNGLFPATDPSLLSSLLMCLMRYVINLSGASSQQ